MKSIGLVMEVLEIRNLMILNLILQTILNLMSPLRKTTASSAVNTLLWAVYTVAGLSVDYTIGLVTRTAMGQTNDTNRPMVALWAALLIVQLMGTDTITVFSIEDSKSVYRTSFRTYLSCFVLGRSIIVLGARSWLAVSLYTIFAAGMFKYIERNQSLTTGELTRFGTFTKPFVLLESCSNDGTLPTSTDATDVFRDAFQFFQTFKGVFANVIFTTTQLSHSREYFETNEAEVAFEVVETELNLAYDVLYTKTLVLSQLAGFYSRLMCLLLEVFSFSVWVSLDKTPFEKVDIRVTYTLILSVILFDYLSFSRMLLSDWSITRNYRSGSLVRLILSLVRMLIMPRRRWSGCVSQYSLITMSTKSCGRPKVDRVLDWFKIKDLAYGLINKMSPAIFDESLRDFLFEELKYRSSKAIDLQVAKEMYSSKGDWVLRSYYSNNSSVSRLVETWFTDTSSSSMEFGKIVLIWHVATDLCYHTISSRNYFEQKDQQRKCSKAISDYVAFLLVQEQTMLSQVAVEARVITLQSTWEEVAEILNAGEADMKGLKDEAKLEIACGMLMEEAKYRLIQADDQLEEKDSVLKDARRLSKELKKLDDEGISMWEVMSKVWMELLCYAACNCKASEHVAQLCKGGQLLTIVWMLMAHFGLSNRIQNT